MGSIGVKGTTRQRIEHAGIGFAVGGPIGAAIGATSPEWNGQTVRSTQDVVDFFKGPGPAKPPPVPDPQAIPEADQDKAGEEAARRARGRRGRRQTFVTGSLVPQPKRKTVLG